VVAPGGLKVTWRYCKATKAWKEVAGLTKRVMSETARMYFPQLGPRAEVNTEHPECWNKDGHADSVERWLADPTYRF
jgi:hypothetical protein